MRRIVLGSMIAVLSIAAAAAENDVWSVALLEQARLTDKPVLLIVGDPSCAACVAAESSARAEATVASRLSRDFVTVRTDSMARPDLADVYGLAVRELGGGSGSPLVVAVTPDGRPYLGRAGASAFEPAAFERFAAEAVAGFRAARSGLDPRAVAVLEKLRAAQTPSAPQRPLGPDVVEAATRAVVGWSELGRADGPLPHTAIRFLLAEHERARRPELLKLVTAALDLRLARAAAPAEGVAEEALRLETWSRAYAASDRATYRAEAARSADRLLAARDARGLFPVAAGDPRVVVGTNGLVIGALALSARTLGREGDRDAAAQAAAVARARLGGATSLVRFEGGPAGGAFLEDHAALLVGFLELFETTDDVRWRGEAQALAEAAIGRFSDVAAGGFFLTDAAHDPLPVRIKHAFDGARPSANGALALALARLARATGEPRYADLARRTVEAFLGDLQRAPRGMLTLAEAAAAIVGPAAPDTSDAFRPPSRETRGGVTLEARAPQSVRAGATFEATLALTIAPGSYVVARSGGALDLAGLGLSVPFDGARSAVPRLPEARSHRFSWSAQPIGVYEGALSVPIAVALSPKAATGERPLRVRVLLQSCAEARCEKPESLTLEVPIRVDPAR